MAEAGVRIEVSETVRRRLGDWSERKGRMLASWMTKTCNSIKLDAQRRLVWRTGKGAPGGRATGGLSKSIQYSVDVLPNRIEGAVGAGVDYAKYVEGWNSLGQHVPIVRHFVKFTTAPNLKEWLLRHGVDVPKSAKSWPVGGPDFPSPFLQPAFEAKLPAAISELTRIAMVNA